MLACSHCSSLCELANRFCPHCGATLEARDRVDDMLGQILPGGYRLAQLIANGGMGRVYRAEQVALGRTVAVKVIHPDLSTDEQAVSRFVNEARAASRLSHPNAVAILDFGQTRDKRLFLVMEYLRGDHLGRVAAEQGPLSFRRTVDIVRQILAALEDAHDIGILHRDLKPENVVLEPLRSRSDFVKVVDFGLARLAAGGPQGSSPGFVCGTPEYMSPEQARGGELDARSDLYSVGVILYELLTRRVPFKNGDAHEILRAQVTEAPLDPREAAQQRGIPGPLAEIALVALQKDPSDRYVDARAFTAALADIELSFPQMIPSASFPASGGVECRACGALNRLTQKFCGECAAALSPDAPPGGRSSKTDVPATRTDKSARITLTETEAVTFPLAFVGRSTEMSWLELRRADAQDSPRCVRVVGEDGVGKTRLFTEFLEHASKRGDTVVRVTSELSGALIGDRALILALEQLVPGIADQKTWRADRRATLEARRGLEILFGDAARAGFATPRERRAERAEALRWGLRSRSEAGKASTIVLAVDDLDRLDGSSRNAFADLMERPPSIPLLVVASQGPRADKPLASEDEATTYALSPLAPELFDSVPRFAPPRPSKPIAPLHVEQLVRWRLESKDPPPATMVDLIGRRVERLTPAARRMLQAFAVWGSDADDAVLRRLLPTDVDWMEALSQLKEGGFLEATRVGHGLHPSHMLIRDVVLATTPLGMRRDLNAAALDLHVRRDSPLELRAMHAVNAERVGLSRSLLEEVSELRERRGDLTGAVDALQTALDLARRDLSRGELDDPTQVIVSLSRKLADTLVRFEDFRDAEAVLREALDVAATNPTDRVEMLAALANISIAQDRIDEARRYVAEGLDLARRTDVVGQIGVLEALERSLD